MNARNKDWNNENTTAESPGEKVNQLSRERTCCSGCPGVFSLDLCHWHNLNLPGLLSYHLQLLFVFFYLVSVSSCYQNHCLFRGLASLSLPGGPFCPHRSWRCSFCFSSHCFSLLVSQIKILRRIRLAQLIFYPHKTMIEAVSWCSTPTPPTAAVNS